MSRAPDQSKLNSSEARAKKSSKLSGQRNPMFGRTGPSNPAFKTGRWAGIKPSRRAKSDRCVDCGLTKDEVDAAGSRLEVHHVDRDRANTDGANLVTLCQSCHLKRHWSEGSFGPRGSHGVKGFDKRGCRCDVCVEAKRAKGRLDYQRKKQRLVATGSPR